jgi:hypothetical protein
MANPNPVSNLTLEDIAKGRKVALQTGLTRRWYKQTLLAIFRGEIKCSPMQLNALKTFGELMHWHTPKLTKQASKPAKPKAVASPELIDRLARLSITPFIAQHESSKPNEFNSQAARA